MRSSPWGVCMTTDPSFQAECDRTAQAARAALLAQQGDAGYWCGELSSSALATAVAAFALHRVEANAHRDTIRRAIEWLSANVNGDGGWGDSPESPSNLSTTLLCWSCLAMADPPGDGLAPVIRGAGQWLERAIGGLQPERIASAVIAAYGNDRTFSAPILTVCALAGRLGADPWRLVPQLPFEYAVLPQRWYRHMRLSVVSYAIPALIAIGLVRYRCTSDGMPWRRRIRNALCGQVLDVLGRSQPAHGGYLEAAPLTAFVAMSLAAAGLREHPVTRKCVGFLTETVRADGSWAIDTNLALWLTTLAINALGEGGTQAFAAATECTARGAWLVRQQHTQVHPFTGAAPGGWGWTPLAGAVPDADDTASALLALRTLGANGPAAETAVAMGIRWLVDMQNTDGGLPTFCRGWGKLPFDRSCPDITAHGLRAFSAWYPCVDAGLRRPLDRAMATAVAYLARSQQRDGSWLPLWFGSQRSTGQANPTYGTAQVVRALNGMTSGRVKAPTELVTAGIQWLSGAQNSDGGWGGNAGTASSIEETALAVSALSSSDELPAARRGVEWLIRRTQCGSRFDASPIGLYFSRLWYSEKLYPIIFTVQALEAFCGRRRSDVSAKTREGGDGSLTMSER